MEILIPWTTSCTLIRDPSVVQETISQDDRPTTCSLWLTLQYSGGVFPLTFVDFLFKLAGVCWINKLGHIFAMWFVIYPCGSLSTHVVICESSNPLPCFHPTYLIFLIYWLLPKSIKLA